MEPGANPGVCVKDRRDAVLFAVQKRGKYGGIELRWREKRQGFASRGVKFEYKDCKYGKEGNIAERMWRKLEWEAMPTRKLPYKSREAYKAREQLFYR